MLYNGFKFLSYTRKLVEKCEQTKTPVWNALINTAGFNDKTSRESVSLVTYGNLIPALQCQSVWRYNLTTSAGKPSRIKKAGNRRVRGRQRENKQQVAPAGMRGKNGQLTKSQTGNLASNGCMCSRASHHLLDYSHKLDSKLVYHSFTFALSVTSRHE